MTKRIVLPVLALSLAFALAACGGGGAPAQDTPPEEDDAQEQTVEAEQGSAQVPELDSDALLDIVARNCPISLGVATDIKVGAEHDGLRTVTFGSEHGDFSYTIDIHTGEIVDKVEPEMAEEQRSDDPVENAINACFKTLDGYSGGAENIKVNMSTVDGVQIVNVAFDWDGQHWDMSYNTATGEVAQN